MMIMRIHTGRATHMNTFQRISRDLITEDLKRHKDLRSVVVCDPVTRQFIWQRLCGELAGTDGLLQKKVDDEVEGKT